MILIACLMPWLLFCYRLSVFHFGFLGFKFRYCPQTPLTFWSLNVLRLTAHKWYIYFSSLNLIYCYYYKQIASHSDIHVFISILFFDLSHKFFYLQVSLGLPLLWPFYINLCIQLLKLSFFLCTTFSVFL